MKPSGSKRHVGIAFIGNSFSPIAAIVTAPILTHSLSVGERGMVAGATAPLLFAVIIGTLGLPEAVTHFIAAHPYSGRSIMSKGLVQVVFFGILFTALLWWSAPIVAQTDSDLEALIRVCTFALLPGLMTGVLRGAAAGEDKWTLIALEKLFSAIARLLLVSGFAFFELLTPQNAALILAFSSGYGMLVYVFGLGKKRTGGVIAHRRPRKPKYSRIFGFGTRVWMGATAGVVLSRIDQVLLPSLSTLNELAYYAVAVSISELASVLIFAVRDVSFRSESASADIERTLTMGKFALAGSSFLVLPLVAFAHWWIPFVFGQEYQASVVPTTIMLISACINAPGSVAGSALSGRGRPEVRSFSVMIAAMVNIGVLFALAPTMGAVGAALATLIASTSASLLCIVALARATDTPVASFYKIQRRDIELFTIQFRNIFVRLRGAS